MSNACTYKTMFTSQHHQRTVRQLVLLAETLYDRNLKPATVNKKKTFYFHLFSTAFHAKKEKKGDGIDHQLHTDQTPLTRHTMPPFLGKNKLCDWPNGSLYNQRWQFRSCLSLSRNASPRSVTLHSWSGKLPLIANNKNASLASVPSRWTSAQQSACRVYQGTWRAD